MTNPKETIVRYLQAARDAVLWKLDGLSEYDARRPLTPTGTNLLGLVKHLASIELGYFGATFGRDPGIDLPWYSDDAELNADMWVTPDEPRESVVELYRRAWAHAAETFDALDLDSTGVVPHWSPPKNQVTLHHMLVHVATETHRHAGHADILREMVDGAAGLRAESSNLPGDNYDWVAHVAKIEAAAATFR
jgi:uncharacterized damage-inducible protein DinB